MSSTPSQAKYVDCTEGLSRVSVHGRRAQRCSNDARRTTRAQSRHRLLCCNHACRTGCREGVLGRHSSSIATELALDCSKDTHSSAFVFLRKMMLVSSSLEKDYKFTDIATTHP
ncbi:unnamed protein product, partial [Sphacelaria rigidula]